MFKILYRLSLLDSRQSSTLVQSFQPYWRLDENIRLPYNAKDAPGLWIPPVGKQVITVGSREDLLDSYRRQFGLVRTFNDCSSVVKLWADLSGYPLCHKFSWSMSLWMELVRFEVTEFCIVTSLLWSFIYQSTGEIYEEKLRARQSWWKISVLLFVILLVFLRVMLRLPYSWVLMCSPEAHSVPTVASTICI